MSAFPELLGFKEVNKDVSPSEAAAFIERMQKEACDSCSEEKKDLLDKMAESLRALDGNQENKGESKRTVFGDDDDEEENDESGESEESNSD